MMFSAALVQIATLLPFLRGDLRTRITRKPLAIKVLL
jgi:hypothetical protein